MTFILVLLAWLAALGYLPFHFRQTKEMRSFLLGFAVVWYAAVKAKLPEEDKWLGDDACMDSAERGFVVGIISMVIAGVAVLAFAGYTLYLAW
jgi:hypothetical protein